VSVAGAQASSPWGQGVLERSFDAALFPIRLLVASPPVLFLLALTAMLLRPPDVKFFEIDRIAFGLLILGVLGRAVIVRQSGWVVGGRHGRCWD
jgi:hypothetical protein